MELIRDCGDSLFDAAIVDFPYANGTDYGPAYVDDEAHLKTLITVLLPELRRVAERVVIFPGVANAHLYPHPTWTLAWFIPGGLGYGPWGFPCWQPILVYGADPYLANGLGRYPDAFSLTASSGRSTHPCPKPIPVMKKVIERVTLPGEHVLDCLCGAGRTGVACALTGRSFTGFEQNIVFVEEAQREMDRARIQAVSPALFQGGAGRVRQFPINGIATA